MQIPKKILLVTLKFAKKCIKKAKFLSFSINFDFVFKT